MPAGGRREAAPETEAGRNCMEAEPSAERGGAVLAEQSKLLLEELSGGPVAQDFAVHVVHVAGNCIAVFLPYVPHALAFGKEAADNAVIVLIGATLTEGIGVAVVEGRGQGLNAICVLELWEYMYQTGPEPPGPWYCQHQIPGRQGQIPG